MPLTEEEKRQIEKEEKIEGEATKPAQVYIPPEEPFYKKIPWWGWLIIVFFILPAFISLFMTLLKNDNFIFLVAALIIGVAIYFSFKIINQKS